MSQNYIEIPPKQMPKDAAEREREAEQRVKDKISSPCMGCNPNSPDSDCRVCESMTVKTIQPCITPAVGKFNEKIDLIKAKIAPDCTDSEFELLMYMANTYGLDPLLRQIWAVKRNANTPALIFAGRDGFLEIAHRSGYFDGMEAGTREEFEDIIGWCKVYRKDMSHPFYVEVYLKEYLKPLTPGQRPGPWQTMPRVMIQKVAESSALRRAFSVSGLYCPEEIS